MILAPPHGWAWSMGDGEIPYLYTKQKIHYQYPNNLYSWPGLVHKYDAMGYRVYWCITDVIVNQA